MANLLPENLRYLYVDLVSHIRDLEEDPSKAINEKLINECTTFLTVPLSHDRPTSLSLVVRLSTLLPQLQQYFQPLVRLLSSLVRHFTFEEVLSLQPPVDFVAGLQLSAQPYNELMLDLLLKASKTGRDAAILAGLPSVILGVVDLWLCTPDIRISDLAAKLIVALLSVDHGETPAAVDNVASAENLVGHGQGLIWKRIFGDKDVYELMFARTTLKTPPNRDINSSQLSKKERTVAQTRLMSILPEIGKLDWQYVTQSHHPDIESIYGMPVPNSGLMEYVCSYVVDWKDDVLVYMNLLDTFTTLIDIVRQVSPKNHDRSISLEFLIDHGLHQRTLSILLEPETAQSSHFDPLEKRLLLAPAALYLAKYASTFQEDFLSSVALRPTLDRVSRELDVGPSRWSTGSYSVPDLQVLASLPRILLLPIRTGPSSPRSSPLMQIPANRANASGLNALSLIFSGHSNAQVIDLLDPEKHKKDPNIFSEIHINRLGYGAVERDLDNKDVLAEASATFAAYYAYTNARPSFLQDLTVTADLVAMAGNALAAINLLKTIVQARWAPLPSQDRENYDQLPQSIHDLPSFRQASIPERIQSFIFPDNLDELSRYSLAGLRSFFISSTTLRFFDWLLRPPQSFSNLVGRGGGDPEGSAYQIASEKFELLHITGSWMKRLVEATDESALMPNGKPLKKQAKTLLDDIDARKNEGVWGDELFVGSRIATLEG